MMQKTDKELLEEARNKEIELQDYRFREDLRNECWNSRWPERMRCFFWILRKNLNALGMNKTIGEVTKFENWLEGELAKEMEKNLSAIAEAQSR